MLRALVSSTPDDGTLKLFRHMPERVVPNLRPYRDGADITSWSANQEVFDYVSERLTSGIYRGVGEFHLFDPLEARSRQVRGLVRLAVEKDLWLQVHSGAGPVKALYAIDPRVKILWAHLGMTEPADVVMEMMDTYPEMLTETSFRGGEIGGGPDGIDPAWRDVMIKHADRIMIGSDTYVTPRWGDYASLVEEHRAWLSRLPDEVARKIAYGNAVRVFGAGREPASPRTDPGFDKPPRSRFSPPEFFWRGTRKTMPYVIDIEDRPPASPSRGATTRFRFAGSTVSDETTAPTPSRWARTRTGSRRFSS